MLRVNARIDIPSDGSTMVMVLAICIGIGDKPPTEETFRGRKDCQFERCRRGGMARKPIGTGPPWSRASSPASRSIRQELEILERQPEGQAEHWQGRPALYPGEDHADRDAAGRRARPHWYVPTDQAENIRRAPGLAVTAGETMRVGYMLFDPAGRAGDSPLKDVRVRRAIAHAIDRPQSLSPRICDPIGRHVQAQSGDGKMYRTVAST
jgi:hypothetical protein